ncbi:Ribonuclease R [Alteracholeplasma palmae J233]|uniref:Ribonuclease R n=1 Tax=Alteracholeplasma palmae (strain ATCC 49389 / J233) TaxID=1318466 RepID=U4KLB4_ALTPJ|nr:ribonuclease R [Alteracholeplasma palmae]CCV64578.1 Ribonuclease R [Alteracholeplasma palmae J233]
MTRLNEVFIWYYEQNKEFITIEEIEDKFEGDALELIKEMVGFFDYHEAYGYSLSKRYALGLLDVKKNVAFLLQEGKDLILEKRDLKDGMNKDLVLVQKHKKYNAVIKVLKRNLTDIVASVKKNRNNVLFTPNKTFDKNVVVKNFPDSLVDGHVVLLKVVSITQYNIVTEFSEIIGHKNDPDIDILEIIYEYQWPLEFPKEVLDSLEHIEVDEQYEKQTRRDLTDEFIITIDGADAKDLDDAISLVKNDNGTYKLGVHIADVSYFVKEGTLVDKEAYKRATSAYLADRVIPMIPHVLSNGLCSLNPNEAKYTITCEMILDNEYKVLSYEIFPSIIISKRRLTYKEVNELLKQNQSLNDQKLDDMLLKMNEISQQLKLYRRRRGGIEFESTEIKFITNDEGKIIDVEERKTDDAEELIESFMLLANETVAYNFQRLNLPGIYRIHEKPDVQKMEQALDTLFKLGQPVDYKRMIQPKSIQKLTEGSKDTPYQYIVHNTLLRAMQKAKYSPESLGHYGLGAKYYSHFTSPIRRYPDLILHRMIREFLFTKKDMKKSVKHFNRILPDVSDHTSAQERKAIMMERDVDKAKSCEYMLDKIGQTFPALIVQMMNAGMFIKLESGIEGFISLRDLSGFYEYDEQTLTYKNNKGKDYKLGDRVVVKLIDVNMIEKQMNYSIVDTESKELVKKYENRRTK